MEMYPAYVSSVNLDCEKTNNSLNGSNEENEGWHYLAVKILSALLKKITSKNNGNPYCLNCLDSLRTEKSL